MNHKIVTNDVIPTLRPHTQFNQNLKKQK